jgi:hypothetical protein
MAGSKTNYLENRVLDTFLRNQASGQVATVYVGLFTAITDGEVPTVTEVSGNAYARQSVAFDAASGGATQNTSQITFPTATPSGWGTIVGAGIYDALSGGNLLYWFDLDANKTVNAGDVFQFAAGAIDITEG